MSGTEKQSDEFTDLDTDDDIMFEDDDFNDAVSKAKASDDDDGDDDGDPIDADDDGDADDDDPDAEEVVFADDDDDDGPDDGDADDDDDDHGRKTRNRIGRERRLRQKSDTEAAQLRERLAAAEQERDEARRDSVKSRRTSLKLSISEVERVRRTLYSELKDARDEGDAAKEAEIDNKINDLKVRETQFQQLLDEMGDDDTDAGDKGEPKDKKPAQPQTQQRQPVPHLEGWLKNNDWFSKSETAVEAAAARALSAQIEQEGTPPASTEHFLELSKRLARKFPDLTVKTHDGKRVALRKNQRHRGRTGGRDAGGRGRDDATRRQGKGLSISPDQKMVFEHLGLDTADPKFREQLKKDRAAERRNNR